ncbi:sulfotransferase family 2 domain-containing protein [Rhodohalobacter mucosus]|uniref:Sulfotransferase family protein n=1 Tax=Rhodohalobacter mucosus TaxID=2079485 RepID=A0A316TVF7_9BACT|nr:sulfotransferase family 2 domain-containing protein [Rhodohalobacter mucosus]PWN07791.1 hypothetical protein DDZ15_01905 [Rhodohalobacter mucosus]
MSALSLNITDELVSFLSHVKNRKEFNELRKPGSEYSLAGFDRLHSIFIHIPKNAGVSINMSLFGNKGGGHLTAVQYKKIFGPITFHKYFKFTFVRNPYSRLLSAYLFLKKGGMNRKNELWADQNLSGYNSFDAFVKEWVNKENIKTYYHFLPQCHFICDNNLSPQVDFIGRLENIERDYNYICRTLGVSKSLMTMNRTSSENLSWANYYDADTKEIVYKAYKEDFDVLKYPK